MAQSAALLVLALAAGAMATDISFGKCPTASNALQNFQAAKYMGKWFEIEKYSQFWELGGKCSTAEYSLDDSTGRVNVKNAMRGPFNVELKQEGYAEVTSTTGAAELLVTFNVPIFGTRQASYWVLDTDYDNYALVYSCTTMGPNLYPFPLKLESAWILGRGQSLSDDAQQKVNKAIDSSPLLKRSSFQKTKQDC